MVSNIIYSSINPSVVFRVELENKIKGPDNPTSQLLPIMIHKSCRGTGKEGKTKDVMEDRQEKMVYDKVVYERCCVTKKDGVCVCDKAV